LSNSGRRSGEKCPGCNQGKNDLTHLVFPFGKRLMRKVLGALG
jgi:hypothetical protein